MNTFLVEFLFLGFDITSDMSADEPHISQPHQGNVQIEARFKKALTDHVICIQNAGCPANIGMYNSRNVSEELNLSDNYGFEQTSKLFSRSISF
jgi:hypothetical protein